VANLVWEDLANCGFAVVRGHMPGVSTLAAVSEFGQVDVVEGLAPVQTLVPKNQTSSPPNTYSGNFGLGEFPLHTDLAHWALPPRFLILRCVSGVDAVSTRVLDGETLLGKFGLTNLRRVLVQPRRPMRNGKQLLNLCEPATSPGSCRLRWDSIYLRPANAEASRVFADVLEYLSGVPVQEISLVDPGDTLIVDNWRSLHGRGSAGPTATGRKIERVYLRSIYGD
jgi:L-asparagine oxygenase